MLSTNTHDVSVSAEDQHILKEERVETEQFSSHHQAFKKKKEKKKHTWRGTGRVGEVLKVAGIQLLVLHAVSCLSIFHHPHSV